MTDLAVIEGIGDAYKAKLSGLGVTTTEALLERGGTPKGRDELARGTGISGKLILEWVNHADLIRIKGVAGEYSDLLEAAGVDSVAELSRRSAECLHQKLSETNAAKNLVRQLPSQDQVAGWIEEAKTLPRVISATEAPRRRGGLSAHDAAILNELEKLGIEIGKAWTGNMSAAEAVKEQRREL